MEDASHGRLDGMVVEIDRFWVVCAARGAQWLSGSEQGFDGFVVEDEERCHRPETGQQRLVAVAAGRAGEPEEARTLAEMALGCSSSGACSRHSTIGWGKPGWAS